MPRDLSSPPDSPASGRRLVRFLRWNLAYVLLRLALWNDSRQISAMIRVKNEEEFLYPAVKSIAEHVDEIVLIDNLSTDGTPSIIAALREELGEKVTAHRYPHAIHKRGTNHEFARRPNSRSSPNLSSNYYNWCLRRCAKPFVLKWDGDMIATDGFCRALRQWRAARDHLAMFVHGANVPPDFLHLIAARSSGGHWAAGFPARPVLPEWFAAMTHTLSECRLFPRLFATYRMGPWTQTLLTPCRQAVIASRSLRRVEEGISFLHLKFCKRDPYADFSPDLAGAVAAQVTVGPPLDPEWRDLLRHWQVEPRQTVPPAD